MVEGEMDGERVGNLSGIPALVTKHGMGVTLFLLHAWHLTSSIHVGCRLAFQITHAG